MSARSAGLVRKWQRMIESLAWVQRQYRIQGASVSRASWVWQSKRHCVDGKWRMEETGAQDYDR